MSQQLETSETEGMSTYHDRNKQQQTIRIAVVGATGVGKSSLCNLLSCSNAFKVDDSLESCTKETTSKEFYNVIKHKRYKFKVTDFEGFSNPNSILSGNNKIEEFLNIIRKCTELTKNGITAILLLIPVGRLLEPYIESIEFMQKCFGGGDVSKHIMLVFTKCNNKNTNEILQRIMYETNVNKSAASKLVSDYVKSIDNKCVAMECAYGNNQMYRKELLLKIHQIYEMNGTCNGSIMLQSFDKLEKDIKRQKLKAKMFKITGAVTFAGAIFMCYKYKKLTAQNIQVIGENIEVKKQLDELILNYGPMISEIFAKIKE